MTAPVAPSLSNAKVVKDTGPIYRKLPNNTLCTLAAMLVLWCLGNLLAPNGPLSVRPRDHLSAQLCVDAILIRSAVHQDGQVRVMVRCLGGDATVAHVLDKRPYGIARKLPKGVTSNTTGTLFVGASDNDFLWYPGPYHARWVVGDAYWTGVSGTPITLLLVYIVMCLVPAIAYWYQTLRYEPKVFLLGCLLVLCQHGLDHGIITAMGQYANTRLVAHLEFQHDCAIQHPVLNDSEIVGKCGKADVSVKTPTHVPCDDEPGLLFACVEDRACVRIEATVTTDAVGNKYYDHKAGRVVHHQRYWYTAKDKHVPRNGDVCGHYTGYESPSQRCRIVLTYVLLVPLSLFIGGCVAYNLVTKTFRYKPTT